MFDRLLARGIKQGCITIIDWTGRSRSFGEGWPRVTVRIADRGTDLRLASNPWLAVGEAYMDGSLTIEQGSLYDLVDIGMANAGPIQSANWQRVVAGFHTIARW